MTPLRAERDRSAIQSSEKKDFSVRDAGNRLWRRTRMGHRWMRNPGLAVEIEDLLRICAEEGLAFKRMIDLFFPIRFVESHEERVRRNDLRRLKRGFEIEAELAAGLQQKMAIGLKLDEVERPARYAEPIDFGVWKTDVIAFRSFFLGGESRGRALR